MPQFSIRPQTQNQPLTDFQPPKTTLGSVPFGKETEGKPDPFQTILSPGGTLVEPGLKKLGVSAPLAFGIGLGVDIAVPGPGELSKADDALKKLVDAVKLAKPARKSLEKLYSIERGKRAGAVAGILEKAEGEKGFIKALGKLKGELVPKKPAFEGIRNQLTQLDVDELFKKVQQFPNLDIYEKISASSGLQKVFEGQIPPTSQLRLLEETFGSGLVKELLGKRPLIEKIKDVATEVLNIPRSIITSFDMSAPLRQGVLFTTTKPRIAGGAFKEMFRQTFSPKNFDDWFINLKKEPIYKLAKESKLYIAEPGKLAGGLAEKEERFMTNLAQKIPLIGSIVRASERAFVSYLNKLRIDVFKNISNKFIKEGSDPETDKELFESLASFINNATGRGDLGKLNRSSQILNNIFFSPRLIASRANMLNPAWYLKQSPKVRKEAIKTFAEFVGIGATILTLAKASGAKVETDPRSSDFGKIRVGNTRWDIWGGFQQWVRVFSQMVTGERKTTTDKRIIELSKKKYPFETELDVAERFFRGKLAPVPSLALELLEGQKIFGESLTLKGEAIENAVPLYLQDIRDSIKQIGAEALFTVGFPGFFGVGVQSYIEKNKPIRGNRFNF